MWWYKVLVQIGAVCGAMGAIAVAWVSIGGPMPALTQDIKRLDKSQTETAVDLYTKDVRDSIILHGTVTDPTTQKLVEENLREAQEKLKAAQSRKIELSK